MSSRRNNISSITERRRRLQKKSVSEQYHSRYLLAHFQKLSSLKKELTRLPSPGEFFFLQSDKSFNGFTFVAYVAEKESIRHMYASTYNLSVKVIDGFMELLRSGRLESLTLLVNDQLLKRNPTTVDYLRSLTESMGNVKVKFAWSHAKIILLDVPSGKYIIEGSGNLADNAQYEQYLFAQDEGVYRFRESLFTDIKIRHEF